MNHRSIIRKYGHGLARAIETEQEFEVCLKQLQVLAGLMASEEKINFALTSAFIPTSQKMRIMAELLERLKFNPKISAFLTLLTENERLGLIQEFVAILPDIWAEEKGIETFEVSSAVELTEEEKNRLKETLEKLEKKPARLLFSLKPEIIGGLLIKKGNVYYDVSIKGSLLKLKEIISQG
jgi:F-type H+-transporting ATPase subunit delta